MYVFFRALGSFISISQYVSLFLFFIFFIFSVEKNFCIMRWCISYHSYSTVDLILGSTNFLILNLIGQKVRSINDVNVLPNSKLYWSVSTTQYTTPQYTKTSWIIPSASPINKWKKLLISLNIIFWARVLTYNHLYMNWGGMSKVGLGTQKLTRHDLVNGPSCPYQRRASRSNFSTKCQFEITIK